MNKGQLKEAVELLKQAFLASHKNINLALTLMSVILKARAKGVNLSEQDMGLFELSVSTAKDIAPCDQRHALFRQHIKTMKAG